MMPKKIWEVCPFCGKSVRVPSNKMGTCDRCGANVMPCSVCNRPDCSECLFKKKSRTLHCRSKADGGSD